MYEIHLARCSRSVLEFGQGYAGTMEDTINSQRSGPATLKQHQRYLYARVHGMLQHGWPIPTLKHHSGMRQHSGLHQR
jgi:hypothetical protein